MSLSSPELQYKLQLLCKLCKSQKLTCILNQIPNTDKRKHYLQMLQQAILTSLKMDVMKFGHDGWNVVGHQDLNLDDNDLEKINSIIKSKDKIKNEYITYSVETVLVGRLQEVTEVDKNDVQQYEKLSELLMLTYLDLDSNVPDQLKKLTTFIEDNEQLLNSLSLKTESLTFFSTSKPFVPVVKEILNEMLKLHSDKDYKSGVVI